jgi:GTP-binding protein EngB required for normal cell division
VQRTTCNGHRASDNAQRTTHASSVQGDPNMGKSSVINSVFGKKVVSSSATPGSAKIWRPIMQISVSDNANDYLNTLYAVVVMRQRG